MIDSETYMVELNDDILHWDEFSATRILLVEDDKNDVFLLKRMLYTVSLEDEFDIIDVPRLADALDLLECESFDVVFLDLNLLDIDGVAAVSALNAVIPNTSIVIYSNSQDPQLLEGAFLCGARYYVLKGHESAGALKQIIHQACVHESI